MCLNVDESVLRKAFREITHQGIAPLVASMSVNDPAVNDPGISWPEASPRWPAGDALHLLAS